MQEKNKLKLEKINCSQLFKFQKLIYAPTTPLGGIEGVNARVTIMPHMISIASSCRQNMKLYFVKSIIGIIFLPIIYVVVT